MRTARDLARAVVPDVLRAWRYRRLSRKAAVRAYLDGRTRQNLSAYEERIEHYWQEHYGRGIDSAEHLAFTAVSGVEDVRFLPRAIYLDEVLPLLNDLELRPAFRDKNLLGSFIRCTSVPEDIVKRINSRYFDGENQPLPRGQVMARIDAVRDGADTTVIAKPSRTDDGTRVSRLHLSEAGVSRAGVVQSLDALEAYFGADFLVQRPLTQDPAMARVHPASVNTLRTMTLRWEGEIHHLGTLVRFGTNNTVNDNVATGGVFTTVEDGGLLHPRALDKEGDWFSEHPMTGVSFDEVRIPNWEAFPRFAAELHQQVLPFDLISWDLVVAPGGHPLLLEVNFRGHSRLVQWGLRRGFFGPYTDGILRAVAHLRGRG